MDYTFDLIGISPILSFFNYQQQVEKNINRSKTYLGSYHCTLDAFIESTDLIPDKPNWDWDEVVETMVNFWLKHEVEVKHWKMELETLGSQENLIVARIANVKALRKELETLLDE